MAKQTNLPFRLDFRADHATVARLDRIAGKTGPGHSRRSAVARCALAIGLAALEAARRESTQGGA